MAKGVFLFRPDSKYDDEPERYYQFPKTYYSRAIKLAGEWILFLEPTKAGKKGYHAAAKVTNITSDPTKPDHFIAHIEEGSYLPFERDVPFRMDGNILEQGILNLEGKISGRAQAAVRTISDEDFNRIISIGIPEENEMLPRSDIIDDKSDHNILSEDHIPFQYHIARDRMDYYSSRPIRDRIFRTRVIEAYDKRCAMTGLQFINGGGRAEVEAAHIKPVASGGPDIVTNGIALSGTAHWMFDRGLLSLSDDMQILVSRHVNNIDDVSRLINKSGQLLLPSDKRLAPHRRFLQWHREHCFKH